VNIPKETLHRIENVEFVETEIGDYLEEDDLVEYNNIYIIILLYKFVI